jgi:hypothetical protein
MDRSFANRPGGLVYLGTVRTEIVLGSGTNTVTFHERVQEQARATRNGTFTFSYTGRSFGTDSIGRVVFDLGTGDIVFLSGKNVSYDALCTALSA